jgi:hypothetical protein
MKVTLMADISLRALPDAQENPDLPYVYYRWAAIDDIITRGTIGTWRKLVQAMNADKTGRIARRVNDVAQTVGKRDPRARAFASLLHKLPHKPRNAVAE